MFGTTVLGIEHKLFEEKLEHIKTRKGIKHDTELNTADLKDLVA